jgi:hypothetical protein
LCAVSDRRGASFTEDNVAIAFCIVYGLAAVPTHPTRELTIRIF